MEIEPVINLLGTYKKYKYIADEYGVSFSTFERRMRDNYTLEEALTLPKGKHTKKRERKTPEHETKKMVMQMIEAGVPVPKKYEKRFPELFENRI
ncbi:hypothetical protein CW677_08770 [Macrococcoides caseolyticum]|uniref:hypothetical protein n=1 Tax=Macrococcoides caseolyticum TaxID=69966 RepID=UPI000C344029|nr:hypothetical protein [Macrococcus caseolyticus]PKE47260.1 hypothetical protein CW677_08770 [Macrococcus caseolyticus]